MTEQHFNSLLVLISQDKDGTITKKIPLEERLELLGILLDKLAKIHSTESEVETWNRMLYSQGYIKNNPSDIDE